MIAEHTDIILKIAEKAFDDDLTQLKVVEQGLRWLAEGYWRRGEYDASQNRCSRDIAVCEKVYGVESAETATAYNNLGWDYRVLNENEKALQVYEKALVIR